jgi:hypothetical protein
VQHTTRRTEHSLIQALLASTSDASYNQLSGTIHPSIVAMVYLKHLYASHCAWHQLLAACDPPPSLIIAIIIIITTAVTGTWNTTC